MDSADKEKSFITWTPGFRFCECTRSWAGSRRHCSSNQQPLEHHQADHFEGTGVAKRTEPSKFRPFFKNSKIEANCQTFVALNVTTVEVFLFCTCSSCCSDLDFLWTKTLVSAQSNWLPTNSTTSATGPSSLSTLSLSLSFTAHTD